MLFCFVFLVMVLLKTRSITTEVLQKFYIVCRFKHKSLILQYKPVEGFPLLSALGVSVVKKNAVRNVANGYNR